MSSPDPRLRRKRLRLSTYDYAQTGAYFVTICTHDRRCTLSEIVEGEVQLTDAGEAVVSIWIGLPEHYPHLLLDTFVVMPNHIHAIIILDASRSVGAGFKPAPTPTIRRHGLPEIVRALKTFSAREINLRRGAPASPVWQRGYYEHVIRNDASLTRIRQYIVDNPARWTADPENPEANL
jgi:putative transposase